METLADISGRRSIRRFTPGPVPRQIVERVLAASVQAPSAKNRQPWYAAPDIQSVGGRIQTMLLAAHDLGLGSLWIADVLHAYLGIRDWIGRRQEPVAAVSLGYADESPGPRPRAAWRDLTEWRE